MGVPRHLYVCLFGYVHFIMNHEETEKLVRFHSFIDESISCEWLNGNKLKDCIGHNYQQVCAFNVRLITKSFYRYCGTTLFAYQSNLQTIGQFDFSIEHLKMSSLCDRPFAPFLYT